MAAVNKTISEAHEPMRMVGDAIKSKLPPGCNFVLIFYDDANVVGRSVSWVASESKDMVVARMKEFVNQLGE